MLKGSCNYFVSFLANFFFSSTVNTAHMFGYAQHNCSLKGGTLPFSQTRCRFNIGPPSSTMAQYQPIIGLAYIVGWVFYRIPSALCHDMPRTHNDVILASKDSRCSCAFQILQILLLPNNTRQERQGRVLDTHTSVKGSMCVTAQ